MRLWSSGMGTPTTASCVVMSCRTTCLISVVLPQPVSPEMTTVPGTCVPAIMSQILACRSVCRPAKPAVIGDMLGSHMVLIGTSVS